MVSWRSPRVLKMSILTMTIRLWQVDDFLALTYAPHEAKEGVARPDLDALFAGPLLGKQCHSMYGHSVYRQSKHSKHSKYGRSGAGRPRRPDAQP